jgi:hypothetical protein
MKKFKNYEIEDLTKIISEKDINDFSKFCHEDVDESDLLNTLITEIDTDKFAEKTVLGIDIYHYSQYKPLEQSLIPVLFKLIHNKACDLCLSNSSYIFQHYQSSDTFREMFINSGDGGFQLFDTPIHATAFVINFQMIVRYYNSFRFFPKLRKIVGPLSLRYAMTHDKIYKLDKNYFGPAIINNARVLIKDSLNRFLLDENTNRWFLYQINGIENLQYVSISQLQELATFADYKRIDGENHIYVDSKGFDFEKMISCDIQKIGDIMAKKTPLTIYNLHLQYKGFLGDGKYKTVISVGNLNTTGIS